VLKSTPGRLTPQAATAGMAIPNMVIAPTAPFISGLGVIATRLAKLFPGTDLPNMGTDLPNMGTDLPKMGALTTLTNRLKRLVKNFGSLFVGATLFHIGQVSLVRLNLCNLWWVCLVHARWQTTVRAVDLARNVFRVYSCREELAGVVIV
jgi:hypothetical protein